MTEQPRCLNCGAQIEASDPNKSDHTTACRCGRGQPHTKCACAM